MLYLSHSIPIILIIFVIIINSKIQFTQQIDVNINIANDSVNENIAAFNDSQNGTEIKFDSLPSDKDMPLSQRLSIIESSVCNACECAVLARSVAALYVNCSLKQLSSLPPHLPLFTKNVHLENNNIKNMSLSLDAFNYWRNVTYLNLNNNTVESFVGLEGTKVLKNLVALNMANNRLREIPPFILDQLSHLDELYLSQNPWHCDCKTVVFQTWIQKHYKIVKDVDNIRCGDTTDRKSIPRNGVQSGYTRNIFSNRILFRISKSELCPQPNEPIEMLDIINLTLAALIIIIILKLLYDYWWQRRTGKLPRFFKLNV